MIYIKKLLYYLYLSCYNANVSSLRKSYKFSVFHVVFIHIYYNCLKFNHQLRRNKTFSFYYKNIRLKINNIKAKKICLMDKFP